MSLASSLYPNNVYKIKHFRDGVVIYEYVNGFLIADICYIRLVKDYGGIGIRNKLQEEVMLPNFWIMSY